MHNYLVIRIKSAAVSADMQMQWIKIQGQDASSDELHEGDWSVFQEWLLSKTSENKQFASDNVIILLPGILATLHRLKVSESQKKHLAQALPYLLEENLAAEVDTFHFAHHSSDADDRVDVAMVTRESLQSLTQLLDSVQIEPAFIIAENQLFLENRVTGEPADSTCDNEIALYCENEYIHISDKHKNSVQTLPLAGFLAIFEQYCQQLLASDIFLDKEKQPCIKIHYIDCDEAAATGLAETIKEKFSEIIISFRVHNTSYGFLPMLVERFLCNKQKNKIIDFRDGSLIGLKQLQKYWHAWRFTGIAAGFFFMLTLFFYLGTGWFYQHKSKELRRQAISFYQQVYPQDRSVVDVRTSLERKLRGIKNLNKDDTFLTLLKRMSQADTTSKKIRPRSMDYNAAGKKLSMDVFSPNYEELNSYVDLLRKQKLKVVLATANQTDKHVLAKLTITGI